MLVVRGETFGVRKDENLPGMFASECICSCNMCSLVNPSGDFACFLNVSHR